MQLQGILIDDYTFLCGLRASTNTNAFYDGLAIHAQVLEDCFDGHFSKNVCKMWLFSEALDAFGVLKFRSNTYWTTRLL